MKTRSNNKKNREENSAKTTLDLSLRVSRESRGEQKRGFFRRWRWALVIGSFVFISISITIVFVMPSNPPAQPTQPIRHQASSAGSRAEDYATLPPGSIIGTVAPRPPTGPAGSPEVHANIKPKPLSRLSDKPPPFPIDPAIVNDMPTVEYYYGLKGVEVIFCYDFPFDPNPEAPIGYCFHAGKKKYRYRIGP
jgi:hypothetical protein